MTLTQDRRATLLATTPLFAEVDAAGMERIAERAVEVEFAPDHVIARQGEIGTGFFVIVSGGARVIRDGAVIARLGPGDFFGELSVLDGLPRMAQVVADGPTTCLALALVGLRGGHPRGTGGRAGRHARSRSPAPRPDRGPEPLSRTGRRRAPMTGPRPVAGGTVTFLFSDIEGSTSLEERVGTAALRGAPRAPPGAPARGLRGARRRRAGHRGRLVLRRLPERPIARSPRPSTRQRALAAEPWPDDAVVRVRMGLHSGEAAMAGGSLVGLDINRTARIAAVAHGGQVLLSDTTRALVADGLPDGISLRDLGQHRLKDLRAPERLTQLVVDGLPSDFPPPAVARRATEQPADPADDVRRSRPRARRGGRPAVADTPPDAHRVRAGPARRGCRCRSRRPPPTPSRTASGSWPSKPSAIPTSSPRPSPGPWGSPTAWRGPRSTPSSTRVGDRHVLLVLDNFEQVVGAGPVVADLLRRCPNLTALVTTRVALRVSGEQEYPVPGLPAPPDTRHLSEIERLNLPRALREFDLETLDDVRGRPPVHRPGDRGQARVRGDQRQRPGGRRDLRDAPRDAAGDRARRRPDQAPDPGPDPGPARTPPRRADGRLARPAGAPADAARRDRLELRPARRRGAPARRSTVRLPRRLRARDGRASSAVRRARSAATSSTGSASSSTRASSASTRSTTSRASRCSRRSASTRPRCSRRAARRTRSPRRHAAAMIDLAETAAPQLSGRGPAGLARAARARTRQPARGARLGDGRARTATWPSVSRSPCGGSGSSAATSTRRGPGSTRWRAMDWELEPVDRRAVRRGVRRHRVLAVRPGDGQALVRRGARDLARDRRQARDSPTRSTTAPTRTSSSSWAGSTGGRRPCSRDGRGSRRRSRCTRRSATWPARATSCGGSAASTTSAPTPDEAEDWYRRVARAPSRVRPPDDGGVVAAHARRCRRPGSATSTRRASRVDTRCATSTRPATCRASP